MPVVHQLDGQGDAYAVEVRPLSDVSVTVDGDAFSVAISYPYTMTFTLVLPRDVAHNLAGLVQAALGARTRGCHSPPDEHPYL
jgi:hypothetical protein